jgi:hypothetical protein
VISLGSRLGINFAGIARIHAVFAKRKGPEIVISPALRRRRYAADQFRSSGFVAFVALDSPRATITLSSFSSSRFESSAFTKM